MASTFSTNLKIELQTTGENSGTWGTITNTNLGTALEQAIVGYGNPSYASDANLTLTYTDTNAAQTARALVLNVTSAVSLTGTRELVVPTIQKQYIVQNNTTGSQSITVKTSGGTGVTVPNGRKAHLYVNGTDVIYMDDYVDINGGAIDGTPIGANSASTGSFTTLATSSTVTVNGGTANQVQYLNASKQLVGSSNLTFDGTTLTGNTLVSTNQATIDGMAVGQGAGNVATNTAVGVSALASNTSGASNTAIGDRVLLANTSGGFNTSVGALSLYAVTTGSNNTATGYAALFNNTGSANSAFGNSAAQSNTSGANNVAVGDNALYTNTSGASNTALGRTALYLNSTGASNTAVGSDSLRSNTTACNNTAVGYQAGYSNTTGSANTAVGQGAAHSNTTGCALVAVGFCALNTNSTGIANVAIGSQLTGTSPAAMSANTTGSCNVGIGVGALQANTTSSCNTAVGFQAAYNVTTGTGRGTFLGYNAGFCNTTGTDNIAIGYLAGYFNQTGNANVFIGSGLYGVDNPAGYATTSSRNTFVGWAAGTEITSGGCNTIIGGYGGNQDSLDIRTSSNYVVLSTGTGTRQLSMYEGGTVALDNAVPVAGTGITFPATQSASSNANTLDDYEEGTWTPTSIVNGFTQSISTLSGKYTKIGRFVQLEMTVSLSSTGRPTTYSQFGSLPFSVLDSPIGVFAGGNPGDGIQGGSTIGSGSGIFWYATNGTTDSSSWHASMGYMV